MTIQIRIMKRCISAPKYIWFQSQIYLIPVLGTGTSNSAPQCTGAPKYTLHPLHSPLIHNVLALHKAMHCNASQCNALQWTCRQKHRTNSATDNEKQQFWQKLQIFCSSSSTALSTQLSIVSLITFWAKFWLHFKQSFDYIFSNVSISYYAKRKPPSISIPSQMPYIFSLIWTYFRSAHLTSEWVSRSGRNVMSRFPDFFQMSR